MHLYLLSKALLRTAALTLGVLMLPLIGMQVSSEVNWSIGDFAVAGVLLMGAGLILQLIAQQPLKRAYRTAAFAAVIAMLLLIWAELAVGLI